MVIKYSYWSAGSQTLGCQLICQLVVICNVDVRFNNCHMSDMTDHLTQCPWPALAVPPTITIASELCEVPSRYILIT